MSQAWWSRPTARVLPALPGGDGARGGRAAVQFTPEDVRDWLAELFSGQFGSGSGSSHGSGSGSVKILVETKGVL